jgi:hypothetical protein
MTEFLYFSLIFQCIDLIRSSSFSVSPEDSMDVTPIPFEGVKTLKDRRFRDEVFALKKKAIKFISLLYMLVSGWKVCYLKLKDVMETSNSKFQIKVNNDSNLRCKDTRPDGWGEEDGTGIAAASCFDGILQVILQLNQRKLHFVSESETKKTFNNGSLSSFQVSSG